MRKTHNKRVVLIRVIIFLIVSVLLIWGFLEWRVTPVIRSMAAVQGKSFAVSAINKAAAEVLEETGITETAKVSTSADGMLRSLTTDTAAANLLKHNITLRAEEYISDLRHKQMNIPLGMIIGGELIGAVGPDIPVYITLSGTTDSDFEETFESGGVNQTVHKLSLRIKTDIRILTPSGTICETVSTSVLLGETVIIGNVPLVNK